MKLAISYYNENKRNKGSQMGYTKKKNLKKKFHWKARTWKKKPILGFNADKKNDCNDKCKLQKYQCRQKLKINLVDLTHNKNGNSFFSPLKGNLFNALVAKNGLPYQLFGLNLNPRKAVE